MTSKQSGLVLGISLEGGDHQTYAPGDTIIGYIHRSAQIVSPDASVHIRLHGRSKSKLTKQKSGNSGSTTYRGRFNLVDDRQNAQKLFQGPVHIPQDRSVTAWPFAITIPTHVNCNTLRKVPVDQETFIPIDAASVVNHKLPPTMSGSDTGWGSSMEGFVEYFLKAELRTTRKGSWDCYEAFLPIALRASFPDPPIYSFKPRCLRYIRQVASQKLLPGRKDDELSSMEKLKKHMGTKSVPMLTVNLQVEAPTILQLENPNIIPFRVRVVPDWSYTSEIIRDQPQKVKLTYAEIELETITSIICEGTFSSKRESCSSKVDLRIWEKVWKIGKDIEVPCTGDWPPLDIGELVGLRLTYGAAKSLRFPATVLSSTAFTYNVQQKHHLKWTVHCDIVGESIKAVGREAIQILPASDTGDLGLPAESKPLPLLPSDTWIQPPPEGDAPPSFTQVQKEDMLMDDNKDGGARDEKQKGGEQSSL